MKKKSFFAAAAVLALGALALWLVPLFAADTTISNFDIKNQVYQSIRLKDNGDSTNSYQVWVTGDGTHYQPAGDTQGRAVNVKAGDGTSAIKVSAGNAALDETGTAYVQTAAALFGTDSAATAASKLVAVKVESTAAPNLRTGVFNGSNQMPAGDAAARAVNVKPSDGTTAISVDATSLGLKVASIGPGVTLVSSATVGSAATNNQTLAGASSKVTYATGFCLTGLGATSASSISVTLSDGTWTATYSVPIVAGATNPITPFKIDFTSPLAASAVNTGITLTIPSYGSGNTSATATLQGFRL